MTISASSFVIITGSLIRESRRHASRNPDFSHTPSPPDSAPLLGDLIAENLKRSNANGGEPGTRSDYRDELMSDFLQLREPEARVHILHLIAATTFTEEDVFVAIPYALAAAVDDHKT